MPPFDIIKWSGKRDSNPRPQPWQGCALPLSYFRPLHRKRSGGETQNRTGDTRIFSPLLYRLSYLATNEQTNGGADETRTRDLRRDRPEVASSSLVSPAICLFVRGEIAQSVEQWTENPRVPSSILGLATTSFPMKRAEIAQR